VIGPPEERLAPNKPLPAYQVTEGRDHEHHPARRPDRVPDGPDPRQTDHAGQHLITLTVRWVCPTCGGPRGGARPSVSYDGSRRLVCDGWTNPCGHIDYYADVRREAHH
jgi:hypothetical protein